MNEDLQKELAALLSKLMNVAGDAAKFAGDQIPPLVQEKIAYGRVAETVGLCAAIGLCVFGWVLARRFFEISQKADTFTEGGRELAGVFGTVGGIIAFVVGLIALFIQLDSTLMVWFAPRLYIVEWLKDMVSK